MKLNLFISRSGYCSRRNAAVLIKEGGVTVNGRQVLEPWYEVKEKDAVKAKGKLLRAENHVYILFNKPIGVTTTCDDAHADEKITDLIPKKFGRIYPVGRLDRDSRGLIILTNDGDLCHRFTHPRFEIEKEYIVTVKGESSDEMIKRLEKGVEDEGQMLRVRSASVARKWTNRVQIDVVICEGKKRHLRRLFYRLGYTVTDLLRVRIGSITLGDLKDGRMKIVDRKFIYAGCRDASA